MTPASRSSPSFKDTRLVYSSDPALNEQCPKCREVKSECTCEFEVDPKAYKFIAILRIEKQGSDGLIEIQGDQRDKVRAALYEEGIQSKG